MYEALSQNQFSPMHNWMFGKLGVCDIERLTLCKARMHGLTPIRATPLRSISQEEFQSWITVFSLQGHLQLAQFSLIGLNQAISNMVDCLNLNEEGKAFCHGDYTWLIGAATTLFSDIISDGKKFTDNLERYLLKDFGKNAVEYAEWKALTAYLFDNDLVYAFCQGLRNVYQHDDFVLNCIAINQEEGTAYLVVNFEHEILSKDLKSDIKDKVHEFTEARRRMDALPRRNIGTIVQVLYSQVDALYAHFIQVTVRALAEHATFFERQNLVNNLQNETVGIMTTGITRKGFPDNGLFIPHSVADCVRIKNDLTQKSIDDLSELKSLALHA